ncbi:uncharacterized protein [Anoplolepis gracilipes]|uniref:uncharacterized protein n=1 Tax=Anoplolepis gracilipes TaxID=354296 RepID=UPI003B9EC7F6
MTRKMKLVHHRPRLLTGSIFAGRHSEKLGGPGRIVEIDEAKIGYRKYNRGRLLKGQWIFGEYEPNSKKVIIPVEDRMEKTLLACIKEWIMPRTTIMSDCWKSYNCLDNEDFQHLTVNHSYNFVDSQTGAHTQNIERVGKRFREIFQDMVENLTMFLDICPNFFSNAPIAVWNALKPSLISLLRCTLQDRLFKTSQIHPVTNQYRVQALLKDTFFMHIFYKISISTTIC